MYKHYIKIIIDIKTFMKKITKKGFTLIELLVAIAIIALLATGISKMGFNNLSSKQRLQTSISTLASQIELVRNNALLWRATWQTSTWFIVAKSYTIKLSSAGSGSINITHKDEVWTQGDFYINKPLQLGKLNGNIHKIECLTLSWAVSETLTGSQIWEIIVVWSQMSLSWACNNTDKVLKIEMRNHNALFTGAVVVNTLNGLIQIEN